VAWPHPFLIYHWDPERMGVTPSIPTFSHHRILSKYKTTRPINHNINVVDETRMLTLIMPTPSAAV